jgi:hypothetical protein
MAGKAWLVCVLLMTMLFAASASGADEKASAWYLFRGGSSVDESWGVDTDSEDNIYWVTHETVPGPGATIYLYKLSPDGEEIWKASWAGDWNNQAYVVTVKEPFVYVGGATWRGIWIDSLDMAVICFATTNGSVVWDFTWDQGYGYEEVDGLFVDDGAIYIAGWTTGEVTGNDLAILKLSLDGQEILWTTTWGTDGRDVANGHIVVDGEYVYAAGYMDGDALLVTFSKATGDYVWHQTWGGGWYDEAYGMTSDGQFLYVVGVTNSFGNGGQIFLLKYDKAGNLVWEMLLGGTMAESARALAPTSDNHIMVAGKTTSYGNGENDIVVFKYTEGGDSLWYRTWGGSDNDGAHDIKIHGDTVYIAGETSSFGSGLNDALLISTNTEADFPASANDSHMTDTAFRLEPNYPNPFGSTTAIHFFLPGSSHVSLTVLDLLGREVGDPFDARLSKGEHVYLFDPDELPAGTYLCRVEVGGSAKTQRLVVVR